MKNKKARVITNGEFWKNIADILLDDMVERNGVEYTINYLLELGYEGIQLVTEFDFEFGDVAEGLRNLKK